MKVEVKEAQSNEVLQQGDYVTNLTEEQFDELYIIGKCVALSWETSKGKDNVYISKSLILSEKGRLNHTKISKAITKLTFEEFKQRAINTFKYGSTKQD